MNRETIYILIGLGIGIFLAGKFIYDHKNELTKLHEHNQKRITKREKNRKKIVLMLKGRKRIKNEDIRKTLKVSDATATNYLDALEKEGILTQKGGSRGRGVYYTSKQPTLKKNG
mgnify:CR=1 FL=1